MSQSSRSWLDQIQAWFRGSCTMQPPTPQPAPKAHPRGTTHAARTRLDYFALHGR